MGAEQTPGIQGDTDYRSRRRGRRERGGGRKGRCANSNPGARATWKRRCTRACDKVRSYRALESLPGMRMALLPNRHHPTVLNASPGEGFCATETGCRERSAARFQREERHMIWSRELVKQGTRKAAYVLAATAQVSSRTRSRHSPP